MSSATSAPSEPLRLHQRCVVVVTHKCRKERKIAGVLCWTDKCGAGKERKIAGLLWWTGKCRSMVQAKSAKCLSPIGFSLFQWLLHFHMSVLRVLCTSIHWVRMNFKGSYSEEPQQCIFPLFLQNNAWTNAHTKHTRACRSTRLGGWILLVSYEYSCFMSAAAVCMRWHPQILTCSQVSVIIIKDNKAEIRWRGRPFIVVCSAKLRDKLYEYGDN